MGITGKELVASAVVPGLGAWLLALTDKSIDAEQAATIGLSMGAFCLMAIPFCLAVLRNRSN